MVPTLRTSEASDAVHLVFGAAEVLLRRGELQAAFIHAVIAPTLRYPTDDLPYYGRFASRLRKLHARAREFAGDMCLFRGEVEEGA